MVDETRVDAPGRQVDPLEWLAGVGVEQCCVVCEVRDGHVAG